MLHAVVGIPPVRNAELLKDDMELEPSELLDFDLGFESKKMNNL